MFTFVMILYPVVLRLIWLLVVKQKTLALLCCSDELFVDSSLEAAAVASKPSSSSLITGDIFFSLCLPWHDWPALQT